MHLPMKPMRRMLTVALLLGASAAMAATSLYRIDPLPRKNSIVPIFAMAINDQGDVAGLAVDRSTNANHGYRYAGGVLTILRNSSDVSIRGMNLDGDVLGLMTVKVGGSRTKHTIIWHADGVREDLGDIGDPRGINAADQVVGSRNVDGATRGFLYDHGTITDLGDFGKGGYIVARAINDAGWVTGTVRDDKARDSVFLWKDGVMHDIGTLGGTVAEPRAINAQGHVVGLSTDSDGVMKGFFYDGATMTALAPAADDRQVLAYGINGHDEVVGCDTQQRSVIWRNGHSELLKPMFDDSAELWDNLYCPVGINDSGQMAGSGTYQPHVRAKSRAYMIMPLNR